MSLRFYTYIHRRASDGQVFYVGKGHAKRAWTTVNRNPHWVSTFKKHGLIVEVVAYWFSEEAAFDHEKVLIAEYRNSGLKLCNKTDGGDGTSGFKFSDESREKLSIARRKRIITEETKLKMSESNKGHKVSAETRAKISAWHTGRIVSAETKVNISKSKLGTIITAEQRKKISIAMTGRYINEETRKKISIIHKGKVITAEQRLKISNKLKQNAKNKREGIPC